MNESQYYAEQNQPDTKECTLYYPSPIWNSRKQIRVCLGLGVRCGYDIKQGHKEIGGGGATEVFFNLVVVSKVFKS